MTSERRLRAFNAIVRTSLLGLFIPGLFTAAALLLPPEYVRLTLVLPFLLAFFLIRKDFKSRWIIKDRVHLFTFLAVLSAPFAAILSAYYSTKAVTWLIEKLGLPEMHFSTPFSQMSAPDAALLFFLGVILAPIAEEIWYREINLKEALKGLRPTMATLLTSLLFTISHFGLFYERNALLIGFSGIFITSVVLSILRLSYGLLAAILAHSIINFFWLKIHLNLPSPLIAYLTALAVLAVFLYSVSRSTRKPKDAAPQTPQEPSIPEETL